MIKVRHLGSFFAAHNLSRMKTSKPIRKWQVAEIELRYNITNPQRPKIKTSKDAYKIFLQTWDMQKINLLEQFKVMLVNRASKAMGVSHISSGGISQTTVDARLIFAVALKGGASGVIVAHNHPSGNLSVSRADVALTKKIEKMGKLLDLPLVDHIIVTNEHYLSFADEGLF